MKKIIYTLFVLIGFCSFSFAQEKTEIASTNGKTELLDSKVTGEYVFSLPVNVTSERVERNAKYYTNMFAVDFDAKSHESRLTMVENKSQNRYVVARFLSSCGVHFVEVDGENLTIDQFMDSYLK